jgi:hypothetical protein
MMLGASTVFFHATGYLRVPGLIDNSQVERLRQVIHEVAAEFDHPQVSHSKERTRIDQIVSFDPAYLEVASSDQVLDALEPVLGQNIELIESRHNHLSIYHTPATDRLHRDILQWSRSILTVLIYLSDCRDPGSSTRVIPGSHHWPCIGEVNNGGTWMEKVEPYASLCEQAVSVPSLPRVAALFAVSAYTVVGERCVSDISSLAPVTQADYRRIADYITASREAWERHLEAGLVDLAGHLAAAGYAPFISEQHRGVAFHVDALNPDEVAVFARLKDTKAIIDKMRRFGEPLRVMLDIWGFRIVVASETELEAVAMSCARLWETPAPSQLLLRHGQLQFDSWRDYRRRSHAGLSPATTAQYDQAIHLNRRAPFGIVEIQVLTLDLYVRVHCDPASDDSHDRFVARRQELFRENG